MIKVNASELRQNTQDRAELTAQIRIITSDINTRLNDAKKNREIFLAYELPALFNVQYMKLAQAQSYVYANVVRALETAGYQSRIHIRNKDYTLYITWLTQLEIEEMKRDEVFIQNICIGDDKAKEIMADGLIK